MMVEIEDQTTKLTIGMGALPNGDIEILAAGTPPSYINH